MSASRSVAPGLLGGLVLLAVLSPLLCPGGPLVRVGPSFSAPDFGPDPRLWLGIDDMGRSVLCQCGFGLRASTLVGLGTLAVALGVGLGVGIVAGVSGGWVDRMLAQVVGLFQVVPRFFLALVVVALFGASLPLIVLVLGATSWTLVARMARAEAASIAGRPFVRAAVALGCGRGAILWRHVLPNALPPVRAAGPVIAGGAVLAEAGLGFLGLGAPNAVSLGRLVADAYPFLQIAPWISLAPIATLALLVLALRAATEAR